MNRAAYLFLTIGLLTTACDDGDDDPGMRDCGIPEQETPCGESEPEPTPDRQDMHVDPEVDVDLGVDLGVGVDVDLGVDMGENCAAQCPAGMQVNACADDNPQCITVEECGETIYCQSDTTACDPFSYPGSSDPCPEGDPLCVDALYFDDTPVQCLNEYCRATIDDISSPACPDDSRVRACVSDEACAEPMPWCGQLWPGCEMVCRPDQIPGSELCGDNGCDPTTCDEEDSNCTQSPQGAMACYAAECADGGPRCSDLDPSYFECDAMTDDRCIPFLTCGRIQYCLFED